MELAGGSVFGDGLGDEAQRSVGSNLAFDVAFRGFREPRRLRAAAPTRCASASRTRPSTREHVGLLRTLWKIAETSRASALVVLELRTAPAESLARVAELRDAICLLRQNGKKVLCHLEDADGASLYLCSAANRIAHQPGRRHPLRRPPHALLLLRRPARQARHPAPTSCASARTRARPSCSRARARPRWRAPTRSTCCSRSSGTSRSGSRRAAASRPQALRERIAKGPFIATRGARPRAWSTASRSTTSSRRRPRKLVGLATCRLDDDERAPRAPRGLRHAPRIAIVYVDGDMVDGRSQTHSASRHASWSARTPSPSRSRRRARTPRIERRRAAHRDRRRLGHGRRRDLARGAAHRAVKPRHRQHGQRRGERRLLHRRAGHAHLRQPAHHHRQHRHLLRQGRRLASSCARSA